MVALQAGDVRPARAPARESTDLADDRLRSHLSAWAATALAGALLHSGDPRRAAEVLGRTPPAALRPPQRRIRNMFRKLDATSRAEIARAVEQADRAAAT